MSQHDTATATATRASKAVITKAMIKPIIDTQMSSTRCMSGAEKKKIN